MEEGEAFLDGRFFGMSLRCVGGVRSALLIASSRRRSISCFESSGRCFGVRVMGFLPAFDTFPREGGHIGRMLAGYGELEFDLCTCLGVALGDHNAALRAMFRPRGEESRILIADALMRKKYADVGLKDNYDTMLGALRYCKTVRNRYAHCHWYDYDAARGLCFMSLEDAADSSALEMPMVTLHHVDEPLLESQVKYFHYTSGILQFLWRDYEKRTGKQGSHIFEMPKVLDRPPPHSPPKKHSTPETLRKDATAQPDTAPDKS